MHVGILKTLWKKKATVQDSHYQSPLPDTTYPRSIFTTYISKNHLYFPIFVFVFQVDTFQDAFPESSGTQSYTSLP
jgi:hypothetical protein